MKTIKLQEPSCISTVTSEQSRWRSYTYFPFLHSSLADSGVLPREQIWLTGTGAPIFHCRLGALRIRNFNSLSCLEVSLRRGTLVWKIVFKTNGILEKLSNHLYSNSKVSRCTQRWAAWAPNRVNVLHPFTSKKAYKLIAVTFRRYDVTRSFCGRVQIVCFIIVVYILVTFGVRLVLVNEWSGVCPLGIPKSGKTKLMKLISKEKELWNFVCFHKICNSAFIILLMFSPASNFKILATFLTMKAHNHQYYNGQFLNTLL